MPVKLGKLVPPTLAPGAFGRFTQGGGPVPLGVGHVVVVSSSSAVCVSSSSAVAVVS